MFTLNNGNFQLAGGGPVANGSVKLTLSNSSAIILVTGGAAPTSYIFNLDASGNLPTGSQVFGNAELGPFGTFYTAQVFNAPNATGTLITTSTWVVGPSAPYVGTLFPNVTVLPPISIAGQITGALSVTGNSGLPAATSANLYMGGTFGSPILGKIYVGDGTGWELDFAKRVTSVDTTLFKMKDSGVFDSAVGFTIAGAAASGNVLRGNGTNFVSAQLAASDLSNGVTGSGLVVLGTSPTLTTPNIGVATATSVNKVAITAPATSATLTIANGKTLTANNSLTLAGTDGTTQTFPASPPTGGVLAYGGPKSQLFTSSGTFTIPSGVTAVKVTVVGGGGGGGGSTTGTAGGGGGGGGSAIKWLSGLTPANTIAVTVGAGGTGVSNANGNNGGNSSIASGTQTITTVTANGGGGGTNSKTPGSGGTCTNGDLNAVGADGTFGLSGTQGGTGGSSTLGGGARGAFSIGGVSAGNYGGGGGGSSDGTFAGGNGGGGVVIFEWVT